MRRLRTLPSSLRQVWVGWVPVLRLRANRDDRRDCDAGTGNLLAPHRLTRATCARGGRPQMPNATINHLNFYRERAKA